MPKICSVEACGRKMHAKVLCKPHYNRKARIGVIGGPVGIRGKPPKENCLFPDCEKPAKIRNGFCLGHYTNNRRRQVLLMLVASLGGKCWSCGGTFHPAAYDFHHLDPSDKKDRQKDTVSYVIGNGTSLGFDRGLEIASKCALLCSNCHRVEHSWYSSEFVGAG